MMLNIRFIRAIRNARYLALSYSDIFFWHFNNFFCTHMLVSLKKEKPEAEQQQTHASQCSEEQ